MNITPDDMKTAFFIGVIIGVYLVLASYVLWRIYQDKKDIAEDIRNNFIYIRLRVYIRYILDMIAKISDKAALI